MDEGDDAPMITVEELSHCLLDVADDEAAVYAAQLAAHRIEYERECRVLDEQMTRQARATVAKLKLHGYMDLGELLSREEHTRANMWQQVVMGSNVDVYRNVCSSVIHIVMQKAMAMEPFVSQVVGEYISLLQRQHTLTAFTALAPPTPAPAPMPAAAVAVNVHASSLAAASAVAARRPSCTHSGKASIDDTEAQGSDLDGSGCPSTDGGERRMPTFLGGGRMGDLFNTSDTGSEFDPISGSFVDKKQVRRDRNNLAAKGYRQRKRMTMESVSAELEDQRKQTVALQQHNTVLQTENSLLREQCDFFRKALAGNLGGTRS
ncbi:hypothetical protein T492DRAFT_946260 [Pavlovales sp. CCMP2436]|nr:hypothetical protein T492DRAFT_946260 [Pavlovales sp. CCMP2436]